MKLIRFRLTAVLCFVLAGSAAAAQDNQTQKVTGQGPGLNLGKHDTNAPINVSSDNFVGNFETKVGTYIGNVVVTQADYKLRADQVKVDMVDGQPNKFEAAGKVVFNSDAEMETATGDNGVYDLNPPRTLTLSGNVVLTKQKDVMRGTVLVVNMVTGEAHLTARGMPGGRVQSLFSPKQQPTHAKSAESPQK